MSASSFAFSPLPVSLVLPLPVDSHRFLQRFFCFTSPHILSHQQHDVIALYLGKTAKDNVLTHKAILICLSWSCFHFSSVIPQTSDPLHSKGAWESKGLGTRQLCVDKRNPKPRCCASNTSSGFCWTKAFSALALYSWCKLTTSKSSSKCVHLRQHDVTDWPQHSHEIGGPHYSPCHETSFHLRFSNDPSTEGLA